MSEQQNSKNGKVIILAALLAVSLIGNIFQAMNSNTKTEVINTITTERDTLLMGIESLDSMFNDSKKMIEELRADSVKLTADIESRYAEIQKLQEEIDQLKKSSKNKASLYEELKKKFAKLKKYNEELEDKIDKLLVENKALYDKTVSLKGNVDSLTTVTQDLGSKVNTGAKLRAEYVSVSTFKKKDNGFKETKLAKKTDRFEAKFTILENAISTKEEKMLYLRILGPNGKVLGTPAMSSDVFKTEAGEEVKFSSKKKFTNTAEKQNMTLVYDDGDMTFEKGEYQIEIYVDGYLSGKSAVLLK